MNPPIEIAPPRYLSRSLGDRKSPYRPEPRLTGRSRFVYNDAVTPLRAERGRIVSVSRGSGCTILWLSDGLIISPDRACKALRTIATMWQFRVGTCFRKRLGSNGTPPREPTSTSLDTVLSQIQIVNQPHQTSSVAAESTFTNMVNRVERTITTRIFGRT